ncbi:hypothetical protein M0R89_04230 [Halorussus limi]|uniref:Uncharacterized protein n=1 Tax=Halorussus limi TaxID=2938695 RepID=A0A8U0HWR9_9EURY|nr:hypothetical protein [Halorussus limi]UPV75279.1 hypothetical protein M0R89_04230 [Halorussus limi]
MNERLANGLELFARLVGVVAALGGVLLLPSAPILGVPLLVVGILFALRPATAGELLDIAASLV